MFWALSVAAVANERHFTTIYETDVLPAGTAEIEPWTTIKGDGAGGLDFAHRLEFEGALTNDLQTALYIKFSGSSTGFDYDGIASEWKLNLLSRAEKPIGLALYGEVKLEPTAEAGELKLLVDAMSDNVIVAANLVGEVGRSHAAGATEMEVVEEVLGAVAWRTTPTTSLGIEAKQELVLIDGEFDEIELAVGPSASWASSGWWVATTVPLVLPLEGGSISPSWRTIFGFHF